MRSICICKNCGMPLASPDNKFCGNCGAPQKTERSKTANFFLALLKSAGYFAIFFGINLLFEMVHEIVVMVKMGTLPDPSDPDYLKNIYIALSDNFCQVGIASALIGMAVLLLIFILRKKKLSEEIGLKLIKPISFSGLLIVGLCAQFTVSILIVFLYTAFPSFADNSASPIFDLLFTNSNPIVEFVYIAVIAPLSEELIFRGIIYTRLRRAMPVPAAIILSAVIFGAAHGNIEQFIYAGALGLLMAAVFEKYNSIWASYAIHLAFNSGSFLMELIPENSVILLITVLISAGLLLISLAILFFRKTINTSGEKYEAL